MGKTNIEKFVKEMLKPPSKNGISLALIFKFKVFP